MPTRNCRRHITHLAAVTIALGTATNSEAQIQSFTCQGGFTPVARFVPLASLKEVPNPVIPVDPATGQRDIRGDLVPFVADLTAATQLGKALFWDMQAGSDNKTACATCHFQAGADPRSKNQLNPGSNNRWASRGPNYALQRTDFPVRSDDVVGSQGVRAASFVGINAKGKESTTPVADRVFNVGGVNVRQTTGKNAPPVINAVFNHRNFWNGRAQPEFNGVNPFGSRDKSARVYMRDVRDRRGIPVAIDVLIQDASLASQAVGPALNSTEMSAAGRTFPDLGRKLLTSKPLALQAVDPSDSVLGELADVGTGKGLNVSYKILIEKAFQPTWWKATKKVMLNGKPYSMEEANFSLYWGLSIMLYEATLVSDDTPMDRYLASRIFNLETGQLLGHDPSQLRSVADRLAADKGLDVSNILNGLAFFELPEANPPKAFPPPSGFGLGCIGCHAGAETTSASVRNMAGAEVEPGHAALKNAGFDLRMERMFTRFPEVPVGTDGISFDPSTFAVVVTSKIDPTTGVSQPVVPPAPAPVAVYDSGWYNIGVRPTSEDQGLGGRDPFGNPLSWTRLFEALPDPTFLQIPGSGLGCLNAGNAAFPDELLNASGVPLLSGPLLKTEQNAVAGTFKVPPLRNVELTGPYFHNGGKATLRQVMGLYNTGGEFASATKAPGMVPLVLSNDQMDDVVAFLLALTDERVRWQQAPFDHPQLFVPNGDSPAGTDQMIELRAVGASGASAPLPRFLNLNPFQK